MIMPIQLNFAKLKNIFPGIINNSQLLCLIQLNQYPHILSIDFLQLKNNLSNFKPFVQLDLFIPVKEL